MVHIVVVSRKVFLTTCITSSRGKPGDLEFLNGHSQKSTSLSFFNAVAVFAIDSSPYGPTVEDRIDGSQESFC